MGPEVPVSTVEILVEIPTAFLFTLGPASLVVPRCSLAIPVS